LPLAEILVCYHDDKDNCDCRKPKPGLIFRAAEQYQVDLSRSWMVGDRWKDIAAGVAAGLQTIFMDYQYNEVYKGPQPTHTIIAMMDVAKIILQKEIK
jgi:D-glycero-D-manno-heptose 1,7-bisphosphate phosphatase